MNAIEFAATHELNLVCVGSRVTCSPPPVGTDQDYLIYVVSSAADGLISYLAQDGWEPCSGSLMDSELSMSGWTSFRRGEENIIMTWVLDFYESFLFATEIAKALNLMNKEDRVILFQTVRKNWGKEWQ